MDETKTCKAKIEFADDMGDNSTTFHCGLPQGHSGPHRETGNMYGFNPYVLYWNYNPLDGDGTSQAGYDRHKAEGITKLMDDVLLRAEEAEKKLVQSRAWSATWKKVAKFHRTWYKVTEWQATSFNLRNELTDLRRQLAHARAALVILSSIDNYSVSDQMDVHLETENDFVHPWEFALKALEDKSVLD